MTREDKLDRINSINADIARYEHLLVQLQRSVSRISFKTLSNQGTTSAPIKPTLFKMANQEDCNNKIR